MSWPYLPGILGRLIPSSQSQSNITAADVLESSAEAEAEGPESNESAMAGHEGGFVSALEVHNDMLDRESAPSGRKKQRSGSSKTNKRSLPGTDDIERLNLEGEDSASPTERELQRQFLFETSQESASTEMLGPEQTKDAELSFKTATVKEKPTKKKKDKVAGGAVQDTVLESSQNLPLETTKKSNRRTRKGRNASVAESNEAFIDSQHLETRVPVPKSSRSRRKVDKPVVEANEELSIYDVSASDDESIAERGAFARKRSMRLEAAKPDGEVAKSSAGSDSERQDEVMVEEAQALTAAKRSKKPKKALLPSTSAGANVEAKQLPDGPRQSENTYTVSDVAGPELEASSFGRTWGEVPEETPARLTAKARGKRSAPSQVEGTRKRSKLGDATARQNNSMFDDKSTLDTRTGSLGGTSRESLSEFAQDLFLKEVQDDTGNTSVSDEPQLATSTNTRKSNTSYPPEGDRQAPSKIKISPGRRRAPDIPSTPEERTESPAVSQQLSEEPDPLQEQDASPEPQPSVSKLSKRRKRATAALQRASNNTEISEVEPEADSRASKKRRKRQISPMEADDIDTMIGPTPQSGEAYAEEEVVENRKPVQKAGTSNSKSSRSSASGKSQTATTEARPLRVNGSLTAEEVNDIKVAMEEFRVDHKLEKPVFIELVHKNAQFEGKELWAYVCGEVPNIQRRKVLAWTRRNMHNFEARGVWTGEQDEELRVEYERNPKKWKLIGDALNRYSEDCRDRWRNYVICGDSLTKDFWNRQEEEMLGNAVKRCCRLIRKSKLEEGEAKEPLEHYEPEIDWIKVSELMNYSRSRLQCIRKWAQMKDRRDANVDDPVSSQTLGHSWRGSNAAEKAGELKPVEKLELLRAIRDSKAGREGKIPWPRIEEDLPRKYARMTLRVCFKNLKYNVEDYEAMKFQEIVNYLIEAFEESAPNEPAWLEDIITSVTPSSTPKRNKKTKGTKHSRKLAIDTPKTDRKASSSSGERRKSTGKKFPSTEKVISDDDETEVAENIQKRPRDDDIEESDAELAEAPGPSDDNIISDELDDVSERVGASDNEVHRAPSQDLSEVTNINNVDHEMDDDIAQALSDNQMEEQEEVTDRNRESSILDDDTMEASGYHDTESVDLDTPSKEVEPEVKESSVELPGDDHSVGFENEDEVGDVYYNSGADIGSNRPVGSEGEADPMVADVDEYGDGHATPTDLATSYRLKTEEDSEISSESESSSDSDSDIPARL